MRFGPLSRVGRSNPGCPAAYDQAIFTLTPTLSLKGEGGYEIVSNHHSHLIQDLVLSSYYRYRVNPITGDIA